MQRANQEYAAAVARASASPQPYTLIFSFPSFAFADCNGYATTTEALHAQISETLREILSNDEFSAEAPG
jgi:hypothetical protein